MQEHGAAEGMQAEDFGDLMWSQMLDEVTHVQLNLHVFMCLIIIVTPTCRHQLLVLLVTPIMDLYLTAPSLQATNLYQDLLLSQLQLRRARLLPSVHQLQGTARNKQ